VTSNSTTITTAAATTTTQYTHLLLKHLKMVTRTRHIVALYKNGLPCLFLLGLSNDPLI